MQFPYTQRGPGVFRPIVPLRLYGPAAAVLTDGLLDPGADRVLLLPRLARVLGIDMKTLTTTKLMKSATGHSGLVKLTSLIVVLRRNSTEICWQAEVGFPSFPVQRCYWGIKGFLEFFIAEFDGPNRVVTLTSGSNLPVATAP